MSDQAAGSPLTPAPSSGEPPTTQMPVTIPPSPSGEAGSGPAPAAPAAPTAPALPPQPATTGGAGVEATGVAGAQTGAPSSGAHRPPPSSPGLPPPGQRRDWPGEVTERIESVVGTVRDKTTVPITRLSRLVVFGLLAAVVGIVVAVLAIDTVVRFIDVYLPFHPRGRRVWVGNAALGAIFLGAGAFCWSKRTRKPQETHQ